MYSTFAYAKHSADASFQKISIQRNDPGDDDVQFDIIYCGICHSDVHLAEGFMSSGRFATKWPIVPGHELAGIATKVGKNVKDIKVGDKVGVGCISDSCLACKECHQGYEHFCEKGMTGTYNGAIVHGHIKTNSGYTFGGYSGSNTVHRNFIVKVPESYPLEATGPVLCAGITMFSPLKTWKAHAGGKRVGIVGIGGLGQMGIRLAKAMGNMVVAISSTPGKKQAALDMGADEFVVSQDPDSMATVAKSLDLILNTVSVAHDINVYLQLLARDGTLVMLGAIVKPHVINQMVFFGRINLSGSMIGGMKETQEVIDFCAKHNIIPTTQMITADKLGEVYEKLNKGNDQVIRYVLDIKASS